MTDWNAIRRLYMVPRDIVYLNNGSFGPAPRSVFNALVRSMKQLEEAHLRKVLERTSNLAEAAQVLGIDQATLYRKRKKIGL